MDPTTTAAIVLGGTFFFIAVYSVFNDLYLKDQSRLDDRLNETFRQKQREKAKKTNLFRDLSKAAEELAKDNPSFIDRYQTMIDQSGIDGMTVTKAFTMSVITAVPLGALGFLVFQLPGLLVGLGFGGMIPTAFIRFKQAARLNKMRSQLPDTFDLMARIIRAGQTMTQAMQAVSDEFEPPISLEFSLCSEMMNLGVSPETALNDLARRSGIIELKIFVLGLLIQRETGGNLAEMLDNLSKVVRERFKINGEIATLTAEGRMQAMVLMCLPPGMLLIMLVLNPDYAIELIRRPILILAMMVSEGIGYLWIRRIINFDF